METMVLYVRQEVMMETLTMGFYFCLCWEFMCWYEYGLVFVCVCMCKCIGMYVCKCIGSQRLISRVFLKHSHLIVWDGLSLEPELTNWQGWLASKPCGSSCLYLLGARITLRAAMLIFLSGDYGSRPVLPWEHLTDWAFSPGPYCKV